MYNNSANEFLLGGGIASAKFPVIGTTVTGTIAMQPEVQQQRDIKNNEPKTWSDGRPMQQLKVVLDTDLRDPEDPEDDGKRALYVKSNLQKAVRDAVRASGAKGLEVGGKLTVTYTGDGEVTQRGFNAPKLYSAVYEAPGAPALEGLVAPAAPQAYQPAPAQAPQAPTPPPAPAPAAAPSGLPDHPAFANLSAEQRAALAQLTPDVRKSLGYPV